MTPDTSGVAPAIAAALGRGVEVLRRMRLAGGDIADVERLETTAGPFILKSRAGAGGMFAAEAAGLRALRASGTTLRIPEVVAGGDGAAPFLILEDLGQGRPAADHDDRVGRGLADLHRHTADLYGFDTGTYCGATPQPNAWLESWVAFYGRARLGHQLGLGARAGLYSTADRRVLESLVERLATWIDEPEDGPVLVHGDLWSGNLHVAGDGTPALIDPAAYFGHREAELGMMTLFGGFSRRVYDAYVEARPLEPGWRDRNPLYQLYHLMNHATLFGRSYHEPVMAIARRFAG